MAVRREEGEGGVQSRCGGMITTVRGHMSTSLSTQQSQTISSLAKVFDIINVYIRADQHLSCEGLTTNVSISPSHQHLCWRD